MEGTFDITDDNLVSADKLIFSVKGEKKRICIRDSQVAVVDVHAVMKDKRKRLELCPRSGTRSCKYCDQGFVPSKRYCLRVFEYITRDGATTIRLLPWVFSQDKLDGLRKSLPKGALLKSSEWLLVCTNSKFQSFSIECLQDCWIRRDETLKQLAMTLSKRVKADGLSVLKALVVPTMPTETSQNKQYGGSQYGVTSHQSRTEHPPSPARTSTPTPARTQAPAPQVPDTALDDLAEFGAAEPIPEEPADFGPFPEQASPPASAPATQPLSQPTEEKGDALEDWEKDLDAVLGDM